MRSLSVAPALGVPLVLAFALLAPLVSGLPATGRPSAAPLTAEAQFLEWTWAGTGSPCTQGSNLTNVAHFNGTAMGGVPPFRFSWDFGDGTNTTGVENPTHDYGSSYGPWTVRLSVTDSAGSMNTTSLRIFVAPVNCPAQLFPQPAPGSMGAAASWVAWVVAGIVLGGAAGLYLTARRQGHSGE